MSNMTALMERLQKAPLQVCQDAAAALAQLAQERDGLQEAEYHERKRADTAEAALIEARAALVRSEHLREDSQAAFAEAMYAIPTAEARQAEAEAALAEACAQLTSAEQAIKSALVALLEVNPPHNRALLGQSAQAQDILSAALHAIAATRPPQEPTILDYQFKRVTSPEQVVAATRPPQEPTSEAAVTKELEVINSLGRRICSHVWIDPEEPLIQRAPYSPVVGDLPRQMKPGRRYVCRECGMEVRP